MEQSAVLHAAARVDGTKEIRSYRVTECATQCASQYLYAAALRRLRALLRERPFVTFRNKNSSGDEIANVNFYAVCPEATRIR